LAPISSLDRRSGILFGLLREKNHEVPARVDAMDFDLSTYYPIFLYLLFILLFAGASLLLAHWGWLKPQKRTKVKLMP
jgi:hypothetical protein